MSNLIEDLKAALPETSWKIIRLTKGALLFRQGDRPVSLFALQSGRVDLLRWTESGAAVRLHSSGPGETLAEASLFAEAYHCDAVAQDDGVLLAFGLDAVRFACATTPELSFALVRHLSTALRDARRIIELRSIHPLTDRLFARLSELADAHGDLPPHLMMKNLADEIGASPEATYRALSTLTRAGKLQRVTRGRFRLACPRRRETAS